MKYNEQHVCFNRAVKANAICYETNLINEEAVKGIQTAKKAEKIDHHFNKRH